eukprot:Macronucleus_6996.p1 GENE.Macronucleus_6996~~Macronucleus_6996.p1  ORF type:complete len:144 (+),score=36.99 Macronucleus_6996:1-432(+)
MSHNIWNLAHPQRTGNIRLAPSGKEIFGTVIRQGKMDKTVTVRASNYRWLTKVSMWTQRSKNFLVHDEENFCRTGDKVVIRSCRKMTAKKHYYVRNIIKHVGRQNVSGKPQTQYEQHALDYNEQLRSQRPVFAKSAKPYELTQ